MALRFVLCKFLSIIFDLERTNQLNPLPDKDLVDLCPPIEPYQVTKSHNYAILWVNSQSVTTASET